MTTDERKKNIMEHLNLTGDISFKSRSTISKAEALPTPPTTPSSRKKSIKEHLARSSANFNDFSLSSKQRKQLVQEHIRLSKG